MISLNQQFSSVLILTRVVQVNFIRPLLSERSLKMCNLDEAYYTVCTHFGPRIVTTHCARGQTHNGCARTGCWDSDVTGISRIISLCPTCKIRARGETGQSGQLQPGNGPSESQTSNDDIGVRTEAIKGYGKDRGIWMRKLGMAWNQAEDE